ncbi:GNAT family N-acetyltransferase [Roseibium sp. MMSF_3544]|uniref:GNAT family N-acetyltransferase n=1 Tax=unclassified Roseibium TaxID=2629323 RepID=UPI00273EE555|nr:GNAT family N-acetyltransferase [Roseibium sp. MMSF_3544]
MPDQLLIRPARPDDLADILALYHDLNPEDVRATAEQREQTFQIMLDQPGLTILLGFLAGEAVATLTLVIVPNLTRGCASYAMIENVVTLSSCRGRGIGKRMMENAIDHCWDAGCFKVMLLSGAQNHNAHRFYETLGFKTTKTGFEMRQPGYAPRRVS